MLLFAVLVAKDLSSVDDPVVFAVGGGTALLCLVLAGSLRHRWAYVAASLLQVFVIAAGFVVPVMFVLGVIFAALWALAIYLGRRVVNLQSARASTDAATEAATGPAEGRVSSRDDTDRS